MKHSFFFALILLTASSFGMKAQNSSAILSPANGKQDVNPDTHLVITFKDKPLLGNKGVIRIVDAATGKQADSLDLSIPAGPSEPDPVRKSKAIYTPTPYTYESSNYTNANTIPGTPSGAALPDTVVYQLTIIGHFTDGFHFHPVIIKDNTATIYPHNNLLEYGKQYYVTIDDGVITTPAGDFHGIGAHEWTFATKSNAPDSRSRKLTVSSDGVGDFNTIQGCMDFIPDFSAEKWEVLIKNGDYEELVYFRNKSHVSIKGESREGVVVHYANNETFNPHPVNIKTNEWPGTFPSRRAAFAADNCNDLRFENLTIMTTLVGQAEGLLIMGERNYLKNVHIVGSGDALQVNGSAYLEGCRIDGSGDTVLGRGAAFFKNCTLSSRGPFMWVRNTNENHGNVFVNCTFLGKGEKTVIARAPSNNKGYPYAEAVLINCRLDNIDPAGWGDVAGDGADLHYWEYNSATLDGKPVNISERHPLSRQLTKKKDAAIIKNYSNPAFVLGWKPK
ncbi:pectinesterase family protein [Viscerimonas tarda]